MWGAYTSGMKAAARLFGNKGYEAIRSFYYNSEHKLPPFQDPYSVPETLTDHEMNQLAYFVRAMNYAISQSSEFRHTYITKHSRDMQNKFFDAIRPSLASPSDPSSWLAILQKVEKNIQWAANTPSGRAVVDKTRQRDAEAVKIDPFFLRVIEPLTANPNFRTYAQEYSLKQKDGHAL